MKRYFAAILLLLPILLSGCYKQDLSLCGVDENLVLTFYLNDKNGSDILADKVNTLDVVIFDDQSTFVKHLTITKNQLIDRNKIKVTVEPGTYYVVSWANVGDNSQFSELKPGVKFEDSYLETTSDVCGCTLYYGPRLTEKTKSNQALTRAGSEYDIYTVTVPGGTNVEKDINLVRAHRTARVYVKGIENLSTYDGLNPLAEITNIPHKYDFFLNTDPGRKNYEQQTRTVSKSETSLFMAEFSAPISEFSSNMILNIKRKSDGTVMIPVNLKEYVDNNDIPDINDFDILITISVDAEVMISLPKWEDEVVLPK